MKNRIFLLLLCALLMASYMYANENSYFPDGMKWTMDLWKQKGAIVNHSISSCFVQGDTLINGKTYRNIKQNNHFTVPTLQEGKKLYVHLNDSDFLLCDFGLEVGDSIPAYDGYDPNLGLNVSPATAYDHVIGIDTVVLLDGRKARRLIYTYRSSPDIEYITNPVWRVLGPMYVEICTCLDQGQAMCCSFNGEPLYEFNIGDCERIENPTPIDLTFIDTPAATKLLRDGNLFIKIDDKTYTLTGQEVK